ncbi:MULTISPECIES: hypothetical protein [Pseudoalteromonas]|uniref:hypothetical protein n=1 Tax=Pseudoalteromonas TaxID=53246 RepID=UPI00026CC7C2|nr:MULTISPECIES: hypothetical protein [Pseudoalteromonas]ATD00558.1 hypothetical protein PSPO_b0557 [Pseudoalteromonas spongiae UST010723-006]KPV94579.1 hypothetical protein AN214_03408 [Pseudoalteromonas sp. P1-9]
MATSNQNASNSKAKQNASNGHPIADKLNSSMHDSVDTITEKVGTAEETLRETAHSSSETLSQKQQEMKAKWEKSAVKKYAVENPVATAGIAFSLGMLVSAIIKRK